MTNYRLKVTYAAGHTQEHPDLTPEQAEVGTGAFLRDLLNLEGEGITRLVVEIQPPRDILGTTSVSVWSGRIYPVELKEPSPIRSWKDWPDDVRDVLRDWNKGKGLSFSGSRVFKCPDCQLFCKPQVHGTACLKGVHICDDCLIDRVRARKLCTCEGDREPYTSRVDEKLHCGLCDRLIPDE